MTMPETMLKLLQDANRLPVDVEVGVGVDVGVGVGVGVVPF